MNFSYRSIIMVVLMLANSPVVSSEPIAKWSIALHGGAGNIPRDMDPSRIEQYKRSLTAALQAGTMVLEKGGSALDAVEATVTQLENDPIFNAGLGSVFHAGGGHQCDASIMDGETLKGGGVAIVSTVKNPIRAARIVMDRTDHVMMSGPEAAQLAASHGCEIVSESYFFTNRRWDQLVQHCAESNLPTMTQPQYGFPEGATLRSESHLGVGSNEDDGQEDIGMTEIGDTVGCVALDVRGHVAVATSTGGRTGKLPGRVGDSPVLGAGSYADDRSVAVSGTGKGEEFIRHSIAAKMGWRVREQGFSLEQAAKLCLETDLQRGDGGIIAVDRHGNLFLGTNTESLVRAWAKSDGTSELAIWEKSLK